MSIHFIKVHVPPTVAAPRAARWAADATMWIAKVFSSHRARAAVPSSAGVQPDADHPVASKGPRSEKDGASAEASSRMSQWWVQGISAVDRARPLIAHHTVRAAELGATRGAFSAALATRIYRVVRSLLVRLRAGSQPHPAAEALAYARSIERDMPNLAAELRFIALRAPEATKVGPHDE
jgi:hypothetical protein